MVRVDGGTHAVVMERVPQLPGRSIEVEPMRRRHLRAVVRIEQDANPRPWSMGLFASELRYRESRIYLVAREGTTLLGFAGLMLVGEDGHITNVGVATRHRRRGVATRLLLELARRAIDEGATALTLEVRMSNDAAQALYRRFGFAPAGVRTRYYPDTGEDALIMWASDVDTPEYRARLRAIENETSRTEEEQR